MDVLKNLDLLSVGIAIAALTLAAFFKGNTVSCYNSSRAIKKRRKAGQEFKKMFEL